MFESISINYLAIFISAIVAFVIGMIWYMMLFGRIWQRELGYTDAQLKEMSHSMFPAMAVSFLSYLVTAYVQSLVFNYMNIKDLPNAFYINFLLWLGFTASIGLMNAMYSKRSLIGFLIDSGYALVYTLAMATILIYFK